MSMSVQSVFLTLTVTAVVGILCALLTLRVARVSMRWTMFLAPLSVVLSIAAGLYAGVREMLIDERVPLMMLLITAPVALAIGAFVSARAQQQVTQAQERAEAERRAREIEAGRRELITWLSHDLRTPLAGIRAMGEALEDGIVADPQQYYRAIVAEANRTSDMVNDLMELAGLHSGTARLATEPVVLGDIVSDLINQLTSLAAQRQVTLAGGSTTQMEINGDAKLLTRALQNVIANAITYTVPGSTVTAEVYALPASSVGAATHSAVPATVCVAVTDSCGGVSADTLVRAFEAGWRGDAARTPGAQAGTGLGLAITRAIVQSHGGKVVLHNVEAGCRVVCEIPVGVKS